MTSAAPRRRRRLAVVLVALAIVAVPVSPAAAGDPAFAGERTVTVMTYNVYFGADLTPLIAAPDAGSFLLAVGGAYRQAMASDFVGRAAAIARSIAAHEPLLVGLQEGATWSLGAFNDPAPAENVVVDFVDLIVDELAELGLEYAPVAVANGVDAEAPGLFLSPSLPAADVRLQVDDVVLARTGAKTSELKIESTSTGTYDTLATIPLPAGEPLVFYRQWAAVDVKTHGKQFRFVTTHLEVLSRAIRRAQTAELLAAHGGAGKPVVLVADWNDAPGEGGAPDMLGAAGFTEVWGAVNPGDPGPTSGQAADLRNPVSELDRRIDTIFVDGGWAPLSAEIVGEEAADKTAGGLWPSDHAGMVATIRLEK
jgi:hypothetical protein